MVVHSEPCTFYAGKDGVLGYRKCPFLPATAYVQFSKYDHTRIVRHEASGVKIQIDSSNGVFCISIIYALAMDTHIFSLILAI
jgi:hypothetical protein